MLMASTPAGAEHVRVHAGHVIDVTDYDLIGRGQCCARAGRGRQCRSDCNHHFRSFMGFSVMR